MQGLSPARLNPRSTCSCGVPGRPVPGPVPLGFTRAKRTARNSSSRIGVMVATKEATPVQAVRGQWARHEGARESHLAALRGRRMLRRLPNCLHCAAAGRGPLTYGLDTAQGAGMHAPLGWLPDVRGRGANDAARQPVHTPAIKRLPLPRTRPPPRRRRSRRSSRSCSRGPPSAAAPRPARRAAWTPSTAFCGPPSSGAARL